MSPLVPAAYRPVLGTPVFRRLLGGLAVSYLGDGMSFLAVAWLAIEISPADSAGLWVGGAVAAYTLPGVVGALVFGRWLRRFPARRILLADNAVRAVFLGAVPVAWAAGLLSPALYVVLLAGSSLLHAWGSAGTYTLLAELLPPQQRFPANTLVSTLTFAATIAGPAVAGLLVSHVSAAVVIGIDALTYVVLAVVVLGLPEAVRPVGPAGPVDAGEGRGGFALLRAERGLLGLLALTWTFNFLYGPVEVALPLHVTQDLEAPGSLLGLYWMFFGIGAVVGGLAAGSLQRLPLWPVTVAIVIGWGACLVPFALGAPAPVTVASFALGGAIYGPFVALSITLMQQNAPPEHLASVLAARSAALLTAAPLGTALGGPVTAALGPDSTLGVSGLTTVTLGAVAGLVLLASRGTRRTRTTTPAARERRGDAMTEEQRPHPPHLDAADYGTAHSG